MQIDEFPIMVEQLCIGLFVRIDDDAVPHAFPKKGFKIKTDAEIQSLKALGLNHITCVSDKSDRLPIPLEELDLETGGKKAKGPWKTARTPVSAELSGLKRETIEKNKDRRERYAACEKRYEKAMGRVVEALKRVTTPTEEVLAAAGEVVGPMAETFLSDLDVVINVMMAKAREESKHYHALNVAVLSMMLGREIGLDKKAIEELGLGALFHDAGKGRVPIQRFSKGNLVTMNKVIREYYMEHPRIGAKLMAAIPGFPSRSLAVVLQHHEAMDGTGFPGRLNAAEIAVPARIAAVADAYDKFLNPREDQRETVTPHEALKAVYKLQGKLDKALIASFVKNLGVYPPGSLVALSNGLVGMVLSSNLKDALRPSVLVYHPDIPKREALIVDLTIETDLTVQKALRPEDLAPEVFGYLSPSRQVNYYVDAVPRS